MSSGPHRGFRLIDLMVAIFVVAVLCAVLPNMFVTCHVYSRRTQCSNNMRQLGLALLNFQTARNRYPNAGTIVDDPAVHQGDPKRSNLYLSIADPGKVAGGAEAWRSSWVVEILPYLDEPDLANAWDASAPYWWPNQTIPGQPCNALVSGTSLGVLRCPNDRSAQASQGNLSYVVNGGFARWPAVPVSWLGRPRDGESRNGGVLRWVPAGSSWRESQAVGKKLGVMFLGTDTGDQPWDISTTPKDLSDGASQTLLLGENTVAGYSTGNAGSAGWPTNWACPLPNFVMFLGSDDVCRSGRSSTDCLGGQLRPGSPRRDGSGWSRANQRGTFETINFASSREPLTREGSSPFANSGHEGGANFVFCDGAVRFLASSIDGAVYARLITPAGGKLPEAIRQAPLRLGDFAD